MAVHGRSHPPVNGGPDSHPPDLTEVREYEKILNIHDQIFSGNHPRLKVPPHVVRKVTPRSVQASPVSGSQGASEPSAIPKSNPQWVSQSNAPWKNTSSSSINDSPTVGSVPMPSHTPASRISAKTASEIDPIFLTKSDDLVRAETQLQRQRVERTLRDQVEQRKIEARHLALTQDAKPDFDVSNVLEKALEIAKPVEPLDVQRANRNTTASDSFDENSFYSSRAPDSPQHGDQRPTSPPPEQSAQAMEVDDQDADAPVNRFRTIQLDTGDPHMTDQEAENAPFSAGGPRPSSPKQPENPLMPPPRHNYVPQNQADEYEEPEYSPPGPAIPASRKPSQDYSRRGMDNRRRGSGRMSGRGQNGRRSMSPRDGRVVRNHITSPAAPQPSRVSPLAVAKVSSMAQARPERHMESAQGSARTSPEPPVQPIVSRKRRRMQESRDAMRHVAPRQVADSPPPFIKEEPVSPPPFSDVPAPPATRNRQVQEKPVYIDSTSPRYTPVPERREYSQRGLAYDPERYVKRYEMASPTEPGIMRAPSQMGYRRPLRDNQDLRRVASLHHARQPEVPQEYSEPTVQPRHMRATSYAVVERPTQSERNPRYYEEPVKSYPRRYVQPEEEPPAPAPRFRDNYEEMEIEPRAMAPPQRRIVVDEHGNQYYESTLPKVQQLPPARHTKVDSYNERPQIRNGSMRAASIMEDSYGERRYVQDMPPPPPTYRRVTDYARSVAPERRPYMREYEDKEPIMRSESVQMIDYPPRHHTTYADEPPLPREDVIRVASVRPQQHRQYEEPREIIHRVQSVRPGGREVSVYVDDEQRQPREYVPMESQGYGIARPVREERFYGGDDEGDRMIIDGGREVHRLPPRY
ncbi:hypothetical protein FQN54_004044 [Arachnomyces sp. PD_36]|nr:hypothetical protein FQN54_004044 [Arachnomyces sp. PD_36]